MAFIKELSDGNPDGTRMGAVSTDKIGFLGATPSTQRTGSSMTATTYTITNSSPYGLVGSAKLTALLAELEEIRATLVALGLHAGA